MLKPVFRPGCERRCGATGPEHTLRPAAIFQDAFERVLAFNVVWMSRLRFFNAR